MTLPLPVPLAPARDELAEVEALMHHLCADESGQSFPSFGPPASADLVGAIGVEHLEHGGKRTRARLALTTCAALDVPGAAAVGWAAAVELLHNATLIHDDVQDGDRFRRSKPTSWATHGVAQAINAGDLLLMLPTLAIHGLAVDDTKKQRLCAALCQTAVATVRGQGRDLRLRAIVEESGVDPVDAYLGCVAGKTGALFALPALGAAILAGSPAEEAKAVAEPFAHLGVLFQLQDDLLDLYGDNGREACGSDVREGKITALVVEHLRLNPDERAWLLSILDRPRELTTDADVAAVIARFEAGGARAAVVDRIASLATVAHHAATPPLRGIVRQLVGRILSPVQHCFGVSLAL